MAGCPNRSHGRCVGRAMPAAIAVARFNARTYGTSNWGIYACRPIAGSDTPSIHAYGLASDDHPPSKAVGDLVAQFYVDHADLFLVYEVVYWRRVWSALRSYWHRYTGSNPHTDHVHTGLCADAASLSEVQMAARLQQALGPAVPWDAIAAALAYTKARCTRRPYRRGDRHDDVELIARLLRSWGSSFTQHDPLRAGRTNPRYFSSGMAEAVGRFQRRTRANVTKRVGLGTFERLTRHAA